MVKLPIIHTTYDYKLFDNIRVLNTIILSIYIKEIIMEQEQCILCVEPVKIVAISECNHSPICYLCMIKMRIINKTPLCPICK